MIAILAFFAWIIVGAWGLCKAHRYEADLDVLDAFFCVAIGGVFGPLSLLIMFCQWSTHRPPIVIAKKIEP